VRYERQELTYVYKLSPGILNRQQFSIAALKNNLRPGLCRTFAASLHNDLRNVIYRYYSDDASPVSFSLTKDDCPR
jgi:hypothetical protein